jgi:hypothetical protein
MGMVQICKCRTIPRILYLENMLMSITDLKANEQIEYLITHSVIDFNIYIGIQYHSLLFGKLR